MGKMKLNPPHGAKKVSRLKGTAMNHSSFVTVPHAIRRGDIFYADLSPVVGSEQGGLRPVLIIQNDVGNKYSPTVIAAAITSRMSKTRLPTHIDVPADRAGLARDSVILLEQIRTLDKHRLRERIGHLDDVQMREVNTALAVSCGLPAQPYAAAAAVRDGVSAT